MKVRLKNRNQLPYGGSYTWTDPMVGRSVTGTTFDMLLDKAMELRRANSIPIGLGFEEEIETALCRDYPDEATNIDPALPHKRRLGMMDVVRGTEVMIAHKLAGSPLVSQEEANRRAEICSKCQFNASFSMPCGGICSQLENVVRSVIGSGSTPFDSNVRSCGICACFSAVAVWLPLEYQCKGVTEDMVKQFDAVRENYPCWKVCSP